MKVSKTEIWFETGFQQPKSGLQKNGISIPNSNRWWWLKVVEFSRMAAWKSVVVYSCPRADSTLWGCLVYDPHPIIQQFPSPDKQFSLSSAFFCLVDEVSSPHLHCHPMHFHHWLTWPVSKACSYFLKPMTQCIMCLVDCVKHLLQFIPQITMIRMLFRSSSSPKNTGVNRCTSFLSWPISM